MSDDNTNTTNDTNDVLDTVEPAQALTPGGDAFADSPLEDLTNAGAPQSVIRLVHGTRERFATPEDYAQYIGQPLSALMKVAVKAPPDAKFYIDGVETSGDYVIPEGFSPASVEAFKQTGKKG